MIGGIGSSFANPLTLLKTIWEFIIKNPNTKANSRIFAYSVGRLRQYKEIKPIATETPPKITLNEADILIAS
jgi:hypothetical protein